MQPNKTKTSCPDAVVKFWHPVWASGFWNRSMLSRHDDQNASQGDKGAKNKQHPKKNHGKNDAMQTNKYMHITINSHLWGGDIVFTRNLWVAPRPW